MSSRWLTATLCLASACSSGSSADAAIEDASVADSGVQTIDAGTFGVGGCVSPDGNKVLVRFQHAVPETGAVTCVLVSLRRFDGGFTPVYPRFTPPAGFATDDARYSYTCGFEQADGTLKREDTAPVTDLWGWVELTAFVNGRPRAFFIDGGMRLGPRLFGIENTYAGCGETCRGN